MFSIYVVWGSTYLAILFAIQSIPPFMMAGLRFLIAGSLLYAFRRWRGDAAPTRREWRSAAIVGGFLLLGGNGAVVWAEQRVVSGVTALLIGATPLWMLVLDLLFFRRQAGASRPTWITTLGILVGFTGVFLLISPTELSGLAGAIDPLGSVVILFGSLMWAAGSLYSRAATLPDSPLLGTSMEMLCGGGALLLLGALSGEFSRFDLSAITERSWLGLLYLILFGSLVGFAAYTWLLRVAPTPLVSTYAYVNPVVAIFLGALLAQEVITVRIVIAAVIILSSVALITLTTPAKKAPSPPVKSPER